MSLEKKYFGTDGIRGKVGDSYINPEFILKLGWAIGRVLAHDSRKKIVIGKDTRLSGYMLESAVEAGLAAAGMDSWLLGPMPTPGIAYLTQTLRANAGIVISASHNPFEDNGIKFFSAEGCKLDNAIELAIEEQLAKPLKIVSSGLLGKAKRITDAAGRYIEFCKSSIPPLTRLYGLKIVIDCANGATYHIAPNVFSELGAQVIAINNTPNGFNINQNCGSTAPEGLKQRVIQEKADLGIALDGDGDRVILVNSKGQLIHGDHILYILARDRQQRHHLSGVVGTLMSNYGLEQALARLAIPFTRANVGDKYVLQTLKMNDWKIGGEPSGHIVCLDKTTTGDGIIAALQVLAAIIKQEKTVDQLLENIEMYPQAHINIKTHQASKLIHHPQVVALIHELNQQISDKGRILLRPSGTEPLLRIMVEGIDEQQVKREAHELKQKILEIADSVNAS